MLSNKTKQILSAFLSELSIIEEIAEELRQVICQSIEFEPYSYFKSLCSQPLLDLDSLRDFFAKHSKTIRLQGLVGIILAHDTNHDGFLDYKDFLRLVLPNENITLRQDVALREKQSNKIYSSQINDKFADLIEFESESYLKLQNLKNELQNCYDFNVYDCFRNIDIKNLGYIDYDSIRRFLQNIPTGGNVQLTVIRIMRRLNRNLLQERITYEVFSQHIKNQINYIQQFSPEKLEETKRHNQNANKMYTMYGQFLKQSEKSQDNSKLMKNSTVPNTPKRSTKKDQLHNISVSSFTMQNSFVTPKTKKPKYDQAQITPLRCSAIFVPLREIMTPVRLTNLKSAHKKKPLFNKTVDKQFFGPMRHSPFMINQHPTKTKSRMNDIKTTSFNETSSKLTFRPKEDTLNHSKLSRVNLSRTFGASNKSQKVILKRFL